MYYTSQLHRTNDRFNQMMNDMRNTENNLIQKQSFVENNEQEYKIEVALPGVGKDDLKIDIKKDVLTITVDESCESVFVSKTFKKRYGLPKEGVSLDKISAKMEDGILTLVIPKVTVEEFTMKVTID